MDLEKNRGLSVAYIVHDVHDVAVQRRLKLFASEGAVVRLGGFRRHAGGLGAECPVAVVDLGRTRDARLFHRAASVLRLLAVPCRLRQVCAGNDVIVARNLEMLLLAARVRRPGQRLVYECLDVHRLMLGTGLASRAMRWLERWLLGRTDLVVVSSAAYVRDYFAALQGRGEGMLLVENKVAGDPPGMRVTGLGQGRLCGRVDGSTKSFVIGWFGMLRCRKSLRVLSRLAELSDGRIRVVIAGIPSPAEFPDFAVEVARSPWLEFLGSYTTEGLADLYARVDFVWAVDYFEEGLNSAWLLPNRLYEGLAHGTVPIALRTVETGRWLAAHGAGLLVDDPERELGARLAALLPDDYAAMVAKVAQLPEGALYQNGEERRAIVDAVTGRGSPSHPDPQRSTPTAMVDGEVADAA